MLSKLMTVRPLVHAAGGGGGTSTSKGASLITRRRSQTKSTSNTLQIQNQTNHGLGQRQHLQQQHHQQQQQGGISASVSTSARQESSNLLLLSQSKPPTVPSTASPPLTLQQQNPSSSNYNSYSTKSSFSTRRLQSQQRHRRGGRRDSDKHGRMVTRRVIRSPTYLKTKKTRKEKLLSTSSKKSLWRKILRQFGPIVVPKKIPKILVGQNIMPQSLKPPPSLPSSSSSTAVIVESGGTAVTTSSANNATAHLVRGATQGESVSVLTGPSSSSSSSALASNAKQTLEKQTNVLQATTTQASTTTQVQTAQATSTQKLIAPSPPKTIQLSSTKKLLNWLRNNTAVLILNCGSIATLTAFTRTDILELRILSITGSLTSIVYFLSRPPALRAWPPILWSAIFVGTNAFMAYHIVEERKGKVRKPWSEKEEEVYEEHFLPYNVTPRQFEKLLSVAKRRELNRGNVLIQKGEKFQSVYLVIEGQTEACTTLSRRVTAASSVKGNRDALKGGDAGAWIGELAFLEMLGGLYTKDGSENNSGSDGSRTVTAADLKKRLSERSSVVKAVRRLTQSKPIHDTNGNNGGGITDPQGEINNNSTATATATNKGHTKLNGAFLTYMATEDSTVVLEWDHDELAELVQKSSADMRISLTNAMTAALVGKVVNLYTSKSELGKVTTKSSSSTKQNVSLWRKLLWWKKEDKSNVQQEENSTNELERALTE